MDEPHGSEHGGGSLKEKLKKIPKWVWIAGGGVIIFALVMRSRGGGVAVPSQVGAIPGGSDSGGGGGGSIGGGGSGDLNQKVIDAIGGLTGSITERDTAISNQLSGLTDSINALTIPATSTDAGLNAQANTLSKYSSFIPFVDPEGYHNQTAAAMKQVEAFTQGFGGGNYKTATGDVKKSLIEVEKNFKNPTSEWVNAETSRTKSVIAYREATGQDTSAQTTHLNRLTNAATKTAAVVKEPEHLSTKSNQQRYHK